MVVVAFVVLFVVPVPQPARMPTNRDMPRVRAKKRDKRFVMN
jgi:hypothetical protein